VCNEFIFNAKTNLILVGRNVSRPADMDFTTWTRMFVRGSLQTPTGEGCHVSHSDVMPLYLHACLLMPQLFLSPPTETAS